jgi:HPt (histidine-containing phosphotransfer) domain-containing protein
MLKLFLNETPKQLQLLKEKCKASEWESIKAEAHKLKPSFSYVGLHSSYENLVAIENNARNEEKLPETQRLVETVEKDFNSVKNEVIDLIEKFSS